MANTNAPLLVIHGRDDISFPVVMANCRIEKAASPKTGIYLADSGHHDLDTRDIAAHLKTFNTSLPDAQKRQ